MKLEHSSTETIQMIQKAAAMGNWWLAASSRKHTCSCIMSHAEFFGDTSNHLDNSAPLQPRFGALWLLAFSKTKIIFERDEISDHQDSGKYNRAAGMAIGRTVWDPRCLVWRRLRHHCPMYNVSCIFNKCLYFSYYTAGYLLYRLCTCSLSNCFTFFHPVSPSP